MAKGGRRPGNQDTRAAILDAARATFAAEGYDRASIRGIARQAGVDPALVHHYFGGKAELFVEVLYLGRDPRDIAGSLGDDGPAGRGGRLVHAFLTQWETGLRRGTDNGARFLSMVQAVASSREAADGLREFLTERVWADTYPQEDPETAELRRALVSSHLFGMGWDRYVIRIEPFASASIEQVAAWMGPVVDRAMTGSLTAAEPAVPRRRRAAPTQPPTKGRRGG